MVRLALIASGVGYGYLRDKAEITTSVSSFAQYLVIYGEFGVIIIGLSIVASGHVPDGGGYRRLYVWMLPVEVVLRLFAGSKSALLLLAVVLVFALAAAGSLKLSTRRLTVVGLVSPPGDLPAHRDVSRPLERVDGTEGLGCTGARCGGESGHADGVDLR